MLGSFGVLYHCVACLSLSMVIPYGQAYTVVNRLGILVWLVAHNESYHVSDNEVLPSYRRIDPVRCFPDLSFCASPTISAIKPLYVSLSCWRASRDWSRYVKRLEVLAVCCLSSAR